MNSVAKPPFKKQPEKQLSWTADDTLQLTQASVTFSENLEAWKSQHTLLECDKIHWRHSSAGSAK